MRIRPFLSWVTICACLALIIPGIAGAGVVAPPPDDDLATNIVAGDRDGDGLNDALEAEIGSNPDNPDTDSDGLGDAEEAQRGTLFDDADTDGDNASDGLEVQAGTDPLDPTEKPAGTCGPDSMFECANEVPDSIIVIEPTNAPECDGPDDPFVCADDTEDGVLLAGDRDGDGVDDTTEGMIGTDPDNPDTDGNGLPDGYCMPHFDDTDGDGIAETVFLCAGYDFDGDGLGDAEEVSLGTDFLNPDTDGDKVSDGVEVQEGKNPLDPDDNPTPASQGLVGEGTETASPVAGDGANEPTAESTTSATGQEDDDEVPIELATEVPSPDAG